VFSSWGEFVRVVAAAVGVAVDTLGVATRGVAPMRGVAAMRGVRLSGIVMTAPRSDMRRIPVFVCVCI